MRRPETDRALVVSHATPPRSPVAEEEVQSPLFVAQRAIALSEGTNGAPFVSDVRAMRKIFRLADGGTARRVDSGVVLFLSLSLSLSSRDMWKMGTHKNQVSLVVHRVGEELVLDGTLDDALFDDDDESRGEVDAETGEIIVTVRRIITF